MASTVTWLSRDATWLVVVVLPTQTVIIRSHCCEGSYSDSLGSVSCD